MQIGLFLASQNLANLDEDCDVIHAPGSDHFAVKLLIQSDPLNKFQQFNLVLLDYKGYIFEMALPFFLILRKALTRSNWIT